MTIPGSLILAATPPPPSGPLPDPQVVRQTAREVLARPEYRLDAASDFSDAVAAFWNLVRRVLDLLHSLFDRLYDMSPLLAWGLTLALVISLVLLLGHITWTVMTVVRGERRSLDVLAEAKRRKVDPAELARGGRRRSPRELHPGRAAPLSRLPGAARASGRKALSAGGDQSRTSQSVSVDSSL